jgi:hypothetical protein
MKKSTEWFISGAIIFGMAVFFYMFYADVSQRAFWFGANSLPGIQVAVLNLGPFIIPTLVVLGIVFSAMGARAAKNGKQVAPTGSKGTDLPPPSNTCPTCHHQLSFIEQYKAWYCFNCKEYK